MWIRYYYHERSFPFSEYFINIDSLLVLLRNYYVDKEFVRSVTSVSYIHVSLTIAMQWRHKINKLDAYNICLVWYTPTTPKFTCNYMSNLICLYNLDYLRTLINILINNFVGDIDSHYECIRMEWVKWLHFIIVHVDVLRWGFYFLKIV